MQREIAVFLTKMALRINGSHCIAAGIFCVSWRVKHSMSRLKQGFWMIGDVTIEFQFRLDGERGLLNMFGVVLEYLERK